MSKSNIGTGKVLVVDDDPGIQAVLRGILENAGNKVEVASDARKAFEVCHRSMPDVIMLDLSMPGIDGYQLCQMLRAQFPSVPIIIVTGSQDEETCARTITKGATDFLSKPINPGVVLIRVKNALQLQYLHTQLESQGAHQSQVEHELERVSGQLHEWEKTTGEAEKRRALEGLVEGFSEDDESDDAFEALFGEPAGVQDAEPVGTQNF